MLEHLTFVDPAVAVREVARFHTRLVQPILDANSPYRDQLTQAVLEILELMHPATFAVPLGDYWRSQSIDPSVNQLRIFTEDTDEARKVVLSRRGAGLPPYIYANTSGFNTALGESEIAYMPLLLPSEGIIGDPDTIARYRLNLSTYFGNGRIAPYGPLDDPDESLRSTLNREFSMLRQPNLTIPPFADFLIAIEANDGHLNISPEFIK